MAHLVSLKVLDANGITASSVVIAALDQVRTFNSDGRQLLIHGVNLSIGCEWYPDEFAAGQSPLCRELDQLVGTGVVAVVSAGNDGAGGTITGGSTDVHGQLSTITDPGNRCTRSPSARRTATCRTPTASPSPRRRARRWTGGSSPTWSRRVSASRRRPPARSSRASPRCTSTRPGRRPLHRGQRHLDGRAARLRCDRRVPVGAGRVHRPARRGQAAVLDNATSLGRHEFFQGAGLVDLMRVLSNV